MKKVVIAAALALSIAAPAFAADMPMKAAPPMAPPLPIFSWTGFYIGGNIGGAWSNNRWNDTLFVTNFNNGNNGAFIGGGQIGGNYQIGQFVIGAEWDFDWAANHNNSAGVFIPGTGNTFAVTANNRWISTVAARFGWAVNNWMFYGKAGGGWVGSNNLTVTNLTTGVSLTCGSFLNSCGNNNGGWLLGAGFEYAFTNHWTVKAEYDYLGLGNRTFVVPAGAPFLGGDTFTSNNRNVQMVKIGVNYLFGGPTATRY